MKSEHRHELKTNELSRLASMVWHGLETWTNQHTRHLIWGAVVAVVLIVAVVVWSQQSGSAGSAGWAEMVTATTPEEFANIADNYPGTSAAAWGKLKEAEGLLRSGISFALTDRASSVSDLKRAQESFEQVLSSGSTPDDVRERALFGLARCREALADGNLEPAIEMYERLLQEFPQSVYQPLAAQRVDVLKTGSAQDFYAWYQKQNPKPPDREQPRDGQTLDDAAGIDGDTSSGGAGPGSGPNFPMPDFGSEDAADNETGTDSDAAPGKPDDEAGNGSNSGTSNSQENTGDGAADSSPNSADSEAAEEANSSPESP